MMLFVAEYDFDWETLEAVVAKRLEWDTVQPADFRFVGEYVWQNGDPAFRGVAIIDAQSVDAVNGFVLHYGPTMKVRMHPATDVMHGIALIRNESPRRRKPPATTTRRSKRSRSR
jgi:hypothetical protein